MNTITIRFRAKLEHFAGGMGYKVPALTASHVSIAERDMLATLFMQALNDADITRARLKKYAGLRVPGVVWAGDSLETNDAEWAVAPIGNGFMADVTIVRPFSREIVTVSA